MPRPRHFAQKRRPRWLLWLGLAGVLAWFGWLAFSSRQLERSLQAALRGLRSESRPEVILAILSLWEQRQGILDAQRRDEMMDRLLATRSLADPAVRHLLTYLSGSDYVDRLEDWERWAKGRERLQRGLMPQVPARGARVRLERRWRAPIGLTDSHSNLLIVDGKIYVPTLGAEIGGREDDADGLVIVDGKTGASRLVFQPSGAGQREPAGIAFANGAVVLASRDGFVYAVRPDGREDWRLAVGAPLAAPPLITFVNTDSIADVIVWTEQDRLVAISGAGKTLWVSRLAAGSREEKMEGPPALALVNGADGRPEVIALDSRGGMGGVQIRDGRVLWTQRKAGACVPATLIVDAPQPGHLSVAQSRGRVMSQQWISGKWEETAEWFPRGGGPDWVAGLRPISAKAWGANGLLACPPGTRPHGPCSVSALAPQAGIRWQYGIPGVVTAGPAIADISGDGEVEILVVSYSGEQNRAHLTVLSVAGHVIRHIPLDVPVLAPPVVGDVDQDGRLEILLADQSGTLHCLSTGTSGPVEWGFAYGDIHNTRNAVNAYAYSQTPPGYQARWTPR